VAGSPTHVQIPPFVFQLVCVCALSPVRMFAVTSVRTLAVPSVPITGWPPRRHLPSRRFPPRVYRASSTSLSENVRVATDMRRKSQKLVRTAIRNARSVVSWTFLRTRADALSSFDKLKLLVIVRRVACSLPASCT